VEAEADGVLLKVLATDGEEYPVGATIAWIGDPDDPLP
jgi:pyruvate/2-oxoglutarate dehydrogenase complex dihydrolipoamide acyltransferase (E2) component